MTEKEDMASKRTGPLRARLSSIELDGRSLLDALDTALKRLDPEKRAKARSLLEDRFHKEIATAPRIAIIGKTGVGKTSTINALFGTKLHVSHVTAGTMKPHEITVPISKVNGRLKGKRVAGGAGDLVLFDMPGLGEDIDKDEEYRGLYADVLQRCDVAVWVMAAHERVIGHDQALLRDIMNSVSPDLASRFVIALNQVDLIQPGAWLENGRNVPSPLQRESIKAKVADVQQRIVKVVPNLSHDQIVPYSAKRRYHLEHLFAAMLEAAPKKRAWVLESRESIADYRELLDPELLRRASMEDL